MAACTPKVIMIERQTHHFVLKKKETEKITVVTEVYIHLVTVEHVRFCFSRTIKGQFSIPLLSPTKSLKPGKSHQVESHELW